MNCVIFSAVDRVSDTRITLTDARAEHIRTVLKAKKGDRIAVGLLGGNLGHGTVVSIDDAAVALDIVLDRRPPLPLPATLIVALPRPKSMRKVVHAATAMGVKRLYFVNSVRVDKSYWQTPWLEKEYLDALMVLGLQQCVDTMLPAVELKRRFKPFVEDELPALIKDSHAIVAHPTAVTTCPRNIASPSTLIIGPEGGFIPYEIELFQKQGVVPVTIGERILRVEEAVPAILGRLY
jgi:16S rRNA (uracil1498-N3)-methyltransferase